MVHLCGVAAIAGVLLFLTLVDTSISLIGLKAFAAAVLGGFGSIPVQFGGIIIGVIEQLYWNLKGVI